MKLSNTYKYPFIPLLGLSASGYCMATIACQSGYLTTTNILLSQIITLLSILYNAFKKYSN